VARGVVGDCHEASALIISCASSRSSGAERHLSARWYGLERLLVCTPQQPPEAVLRRSSVPHKTFSRLQTAHRRLNGCWIITSRPCVGLREGEGVFNTSSFFVCLSAGGLPQQTLLPFLLQLVQAGEHGWVH